MGVKKILLFGYGNHGKYIAHGLREDGYDITVVEENAERFEDAKRDGFAKVVYIDMRKDDDLVTLDPMRFDQVVCVMDDDHYNVFVTLSLHSLFPELSIVAISDSIHTTTKLHMAGATKVIDLYEVSANKIHNILNRPVATELLEDFVMSKQGISFMEMQIPPDSILEGKKLSEFDFSAYDILLVGMVDIERGHGFEFVTAGHDHILNEGDTIVCMGEVEKLRIFKKLLSKGAK
jgi:voltage-gated potassium channel